MSVLVVDVGGNNIKLKVSTGQEVRRVPSGPDLRPGTMVERVREATAGWSYERISVGVPGPVKEGRLVDEPVNLGGGWLGFDLSHAFGLPTRVVNDAAMQALGSYEGGRMLFLGLGTGLGAAIVLDGVVGPLELAHLPYRSGHTYEDVLGRRGLDRLGKKAWREEVGLVVSLFRAAFQVDEVVLGGGNIKHLKVFPPGTRPGSNRNAFAGGFRLWEDVRARPGGGA
jgi:predicted NBD/HSP70 family sugar kinase